MGLGVVDLQAGVDVHSGFLVGWFIKDFAFVGVSEVMGNIIVGKRDDAVWVEASFDEDLIGVVDVGLMPVV
jgi:hypothetical protein